MVRRLTPRPVFFVRSTPAAVAFYTDRLGFTLDWSHEVRGQPFVAQVSLMGLEIILNQTEGDTEGRPGAGRIFVGLDAALSDALLAHVRDKDIVVTRTHWGAPTLVIRDADGNELFIWTPESEHGKWRELA